MVTTAMAGVHLSVRRGPPGRAYGCRGAPVGGTALASRRSPDPRATCRRRAAGRGSRDRPDTVPQGRPGGRSPDGCADARSHLVGRGAPSSIRRRPRPPSSASRLGTQLSTTASPRPQPGGRGFRRGRPGGTVGAWTGDERKAPGAGRRRGRRRGGGRAGIDGPAGSALGARAGARDAVRRCARRRAGRAHRPGAAGRHPRHIGAPAGRRRARASLPAPRVRHRLHLAVAAGPGGRGGVPGADAPLRPGSPRRGSGCGGGRRRARLRPGHRGVRRGAGGPRRGVGPAPGRPADHLRTGGRGRHAGDVGRGGNRAGLGRRRSPGVPGGLPALGRAARAGQLPRPAPAAHAAARAAVAGARPALSGRARRAGRAAGRRAGRAAG